MPCSWLERLNIVKMLILSKLIMKFLLNSIKIFHRHRQYNSKMYLEKQRNLKKAGGISLPDFKIYCTVLETKTVILAEGQTHRSVGQRTRSRPTQIGPSGFFIKIERKLNGEKTLFNKERNSQT